MQPIPIRIIKLSIDLMTLVSFLFARTGTGAQQATARDLPRLSTAGHHQSQAASNRTYEDVEALIEDVHVAIAEEHAPGARGMKAKDVDDQ